MTDPSVRQTIAVGRAAPDFDLPLVEPEGRVTLDDYRGAQPLLLGLFRGLACPFCRRLLVTTKLLAEALRASGVATLAVTATPLKAARLYVRYRPAGLALASDPWLGVHRSFGVPICEYVTEGPSDWPRRVNEKDLMTIPINPTGELAEALPQLVAHKVLDEIDGFKAIDTGEGRAPSSNVALSGFFLIDRDGIVRWNFVEAVNDFGEFGQHPNREAVLAAARRL